MTSQRGNIVIYLLVALALFGVLVTGMWWVRAHASQSAVAPASTPTKETPKTADVETSIKQDDRNTPSSESTPSTGNTSPTPSPEYPQQTSSTATRTPSAAPTQPESQTPRATTSAPVAASGPVEDSFVTALALGGMAYVMAGYIRSRRQHRA